MVYRTINRDGLTLNDLVWVAQAPFAEEDLELLPKNWKRDKTKVQPLVYFNARAVRERLDMVFTPTGWGTSLEVHAKGAVLTLTIAHNGETLVRQGEADMGSIEPFKSLASDALKRAMAALGAHHLYKFDAPWVPTKAVGDKHYMADDAPGKVWAAYKRDIIAGEVEMIKTLGGKPDKDLVMGRFSVLGVKA
jgi:hypothetical protein